MGSRRVALGAHDGVHVLLPLLFKQILGQPVELAVVGSDEGLGSEAQVK